MTNPTEELLLDPDGIPILTNLVRDDQAPAGAETSSDTENDELSVDELSRLLLNNSVFKEQLDQIAADLTRSVRRQAEQALKPILAEAVTLAFEDSSAASQEAIRLQLEKALPDLNDAAEEFTRDMLSQEFDEFGAEFIGEWIDVDDVFGLREPDLHHRQEAVAPCDDPRLAPQSFHQRDRVIDARRPFVLERCRHLHVDPLVVSPRGGNSSGPGARRQL